MLCNNFQKVQSHKSGNILLQIRNTILIWSLILISNVTYSQEIDSFDGLYSTGNLPSEFVSRSSENSKIAQSESNEQNIDKEFFDETTFFVDNLLRSGKVLYNDPVTIYIRKVAEYILKDNPSLYDSLKFYTLRTVVPNAFSTDQGAIFVTTGLMGRIENEAQLAFILSHEIAHFTENHVRNRYAHRQKVENKIGKYSRLAYEKVLTQISQYSQNNEHDADEIGLKRYLNSEYSSNEISSGFQLLETIDLPIQKPFDPKYLSTENLKIPQNLFLPEPKKLSSSRNEIDSLSTHPHVKDRLSKSLNYLAGKSSKGEKKYVVSESEFNKVKTLSRFENINLMLMNRMYSKVLFEIYLLEQQFSNNSFLLKSKIKAWYGLLKFKNHDQFEKVTIPENEMEGESSVLDNFIGNLSKPQLNVLCLRYALDLDKNFSEDKEFQYYLSDIKKEFALYSTIEADSLSPFSFADMPLDSSFKEEEKFQFFGLSDILDDSLLLNDLRHENYQFTEKADSFELCNGGCKLGYKKVLIFDPVYQAYKLSEKKDHITSEKREISISKMLKAKQRKLDLETVVYEPYQMDSSHVEFYNDYSVMHDWIYESSFSLEFDMINSNRARMLEITEKQGSSKIMMAGIFGFKMKNPRHYTNFILMGGIVTIPFILIDMLINHNYFQMVSFVIDAETDKIEFAQIEDVNVKSYPTMMEFYLYDVLYQLNAK